MQSTAIFDVEMIKRYDTAGPRYTSYPTAVAFTSEFTSEDYQEHARKSNTSIEPVPLSLYFHIPFCDTICFYCACNKIATKDYSKADTYLTYLYREIEMQAELYDSNRPVEQLHFGGGTPTFLSARQMTDLMAKIGQHFKLVEDGDYSIEIDPRSVDENTIKVLTEIGFNRFSLGVQDSDEKVQKAVNRIQPLELTRGIIQACRKYGAKSVSVDLIYGLPFQTKASFEQTLNEIIELSTDRVSVFNYAHLPHMFKPQRRINEEDLPPVEEKLEILQMSVEKLTDAGYVYIGMDHFAKPDDELAQAQQNNTLHRNFQGYTTHANCDLVGMGISSISSVAGCYSQNEKTTDGYYARIDAGEYPVIKGLSLDDDDKLRRRVIQQLTCHFKLDYFQIETSFGIAFMDYFSRELKMLEGMEQDALLSMNNDGIEVNPKGRFLIMNICMVFDVGLRKKEVAQRFSRVL